MPNSKKIPDKGLLSSANSGMTELVLFFAVIPRLMRDLILAGGKYQIAYAMPSSKEIPDKGLLTSANSGMTELVLFFTVIPHMMRDILSYFAVIPRLMRDLILAGGKYQIAYAMPSSKEIPDKGLLTSANSGMTELVLFFTVIPHMMRDILSYFAVIPHLMRDLILAGGKYQLHMPCLVVRRFLIKAS
jgi:hypothetical protein